MEDKLSGNNIISRDGRNFIAKDIPFVGDMVFVPAIIQWTGLVRNPFFEDEKFKTVQYYLTKKSEDRESKDKNTLILINLFKQHPEVLNREVLDMPLGKFAKYMIDNYPDLELSVGKKTIPVEKILVNPSGGEEYYVSFRVENMTDDKGLYLWVINGRPEYVGIACGPNGLNNRINQEYGNITPYKCSQDGQSQTCRSNVSIRNKYQSGNVSLYISPVDVDGLKENPEFMDYMKEMGFKGTRQDKNILEVLEKYIISSGDFKDSGWNRRM